MAWALGGCPHCHCTASPGPVQSGPVATEGRTPHEGLASRCGSLVVAGRCVCCLVTPHRQDTALGKSGTSEPPSFSLSSVGEAPGSSAELCFVSSDSP